jgi:hypothetical protein
VGLGRQRKKIKEKGKRKGRGGEGPWGKRARLGWFKSGAGPVGSVRFFLSFFFYSFLFLFFLFIFCNLAPN